MAIMGGKVGIGTVALDNALDVAGAIKVGTTADACDANHGGTIRYNSGQVQFCNGTAWSTTLGPTGPSGPAGTNGSTAHRARQVRAARSVRMARRVPPVRTALMGLTALRARQVLRVLPARPGIPIGRKTAPASITTLETSASVSVDRRASSRWNLERMKQYPLVRETR